MTKIKFKDLEDRVNENSLTDFAKIVQIITNKGKEERLTRLNTPTEKAILKLKTAKKLYFDDLDDSSTDYVCELLMNLAVSKEGEHNLLAGITKLSEQKYIAESRMNELQKNE